MKTRTDLISRALQLLGVLPQGQAASAEETNAVDTLIDGVVEDLIQRDIYHLQDADAIPEEAFIHLGNILAWAAAPAFDQHNDPSLAAFAQKAEMDLEYMHRAYTRNVKMLNHRTGLPKTMRSDFPINRRCSILFST